ncbi:uncharacterized protein FOMMEDRAFT_170883 [Fomitiporia mediterranea MF3/22]|uniref:uncharacterized protein n=1 Tax=Fomitiporia mediterranea (strain MF3/22) TaxID=694068 RepID=UPI0004408504|nr:uncharacterized protein FOMMEDRAFT_170883 [Fomitiporia mediterranea MF3/22]EJC98642.1 hypothetical protein FOMMEDRAFT_170883 [Fomitiporia mediterranea MF3/22]
MSSKLNLQTQDQLARTHGKQSNRKAKDRGERRPVFKSVLSNPFEVKWPIIAPNLQNAILARVIELMQGLAEYNHSRQKQSRTTKRQRRAQKKLKRSELNVPDQVDSDAAHQKQQQQGIDDDIHSGPSTETETKMASAPPPAPEVPVPTPEAFRRITVGINAVTKQLEQQCRIPRLHISPSPSSVNPDVSKHNDDNVGDERAGDDMTAPGTGAPSREQRPNAPIRTVLVCRPDIDPPLLVSHLPYLVAAFNSATKDPGRWIKLISLPKGTESTLSQALGLRRVAVLALDESLSSDVSLTSLLSSVDAVVAPWLAGVADLPMSSNASNSKSILPRRIDVLRGRLEPTHIKQLRTTAPKDMRAAKALRAKGRAEAKAKRRAREGTKKLPEKTGNRAS